MQDLKVVHLINESNLKLGGAQKIVYQLSRSHFKTEVLDFDHGGRVPTYTSIHKLICFSKLLFKICFKRNEIFFIHHRAFLVFSLLAPSRFLFVCHNIFPSKNFIYRLMPGIKVVAVSEEVKKYLHSHNRKLPVFTIRNGVESCPDEEKTYVPDDVLRIGYVGRLEYQKGIDVLINASLGVDKSKNVDLKIVGDGSLFLQISQLLSQQANKCSIQLLGYSSRPWALLRNCDYVIVPSRYEGFGLVAYEAISRGHSVILSDLDVFSAMKNSENVRFVQPGDVNDLKKCIDSLEKIDVKNNGCQTGMTDYFISVDTMISQYDQLVSREFAKEGCKN